jgi:hypothetical protein
LPYMLVLWLFTFIACFIVFHKIKKKITFGGEVAGVLFFLFLVCQILHVFLFDISLHCALIDLAYI